MAHVLVSASDGLRCLDGDRDRSAAVFFFFSSRRRHTRSDRDWSSDVCSSDLKPSSAAKGNDGIGTANGPEHAGLFEAAADDGFAARFDHAGTHKQMLATELGIDRKSVV